MNRKKWAKLTDEEKRIKVAELREYEKGSGNGWNGVLGHIDGKDYVRCPDYLNDLNAMHKVTDNMNDHQLSLYCDWLLELAGENKGGAFEATAEQRAEAFFLAMETE